MKVGFFLLKFPLSSETFVLNQITAFIDMGFEVEIVALQKGDTQNTHAAWTKYNLAVRTRWLQDEPTGKVAKLLHRASQTLRGIHRKNTAGTQPQTLWCRVAEPDFVCHLRRSQHRFAPMCSSLILARRGNRSKTTRTGCHSRQNCHYFPRH